MPSAIRLMDIMLVNDPIISFTALTSIHSEPHDIQQHKLRVQMVRPVSGGIAVMAYAPDHTFIYMNKVSLSAPGACLLTTNFKVDVAKLGELGTFYVQALLDGKLVAFAPLTLRRG